MPLLLECLHSYDAPSRAAASRLLLLTVRSTWQRQAVHAPLLWAHLVSAFERDAQGTSVGQLQALLSASGSGGGSGGSNGGDVSAAVAVESSGVGGPGAAAAGSTSLRGGGGGSGEEDGSRSGCGGDKESAAGVEVLTSVGALCRVLAGACGSEALWKAVEGTVIAEQGNTTSMLVHLMHGLRQESGGV